MRNPFKRQPRPTDKPTLRERMAATREKFGRARKAVAVARIMLAPEPQPEPPVDRAALLNYATFLAWERNRVCAELYPHLGTRAAGFVLGMNAAERFFHRDEAGRGRAGLQAASTRAVAVLDLVGVDWRSDAPGNGIERSNGASACFDTGERPAVPYGWPAIDAVLVAAADDLLRLDAAIEALTQGSERDNEDVPGYMDLDKARGAALATLSGKPRAKSLRGLQARARALLSPGLEGDQLSALDVGQALAWDLLGIDGRAIEPHPDPIFAAIKECERLEALAAAEEDRNTSGDSTPTQTAAVVAVWDHINGPLSETVPTTAAGCVALARLIPKLFDRWAASLDGEQAGKLFRLIDRSPAL